MKPSTEELIEDFDEAARIWGWEQDQGCGPEVDESEKSYNETKKRLLKRARYLERALAREKERNRRTNESTYHGPG